MKIEDCLTVAEAAEALEKKPAVVRRAIKQKKIRVVRRGWLVFIPKSELAKLRS